MPNKAKRKAVPKPTKEKPNIELNKAVKLQALLQNMQKTLEKEYSRLDVEFLQLASMIEEKPANLITDSTPVIFENEEEINKKDIVLLPVQPVTLNVQGFQEEEEEEEDC